MLTEMRGSTKFTEVSWDYPGLPLFKIHIVYFLDREYNPRAIYFQRQDGQLKEYQKTDSKPP